MTDWAAIITAAVAASAAMVAGLAVLAAWLSGLLEPVLGAMLLGIAPVGAAVLVNNLVSGIRDREAEAERWLDQHWQKVQAAHAKGGR